MILGYITRARPASRYAHIKFVCEECQPLAVARLISSFESSADVISREAVDHAFSLR